MEIADWSPQKIGFLSLGPSRWEIGRWEKEKATMRLHQKIAFSEYVVGKIQLFAVLIRLPRSRAIYELIKGMKEKQ